MIWLTLFFCLANGAECREQRDFQPFAVPMACAIAGQQAAAEWVRKHPAYVLRETLCEPEGREQRRM